MKATRDGFGDGLAELGKQYKDVVALSADSAQTTRAAVLGPDRLIQCGMAEQNMIGIAAGLAVEGKVPFVTAFACAHPGRNWEQIRTVCYNNLNVKIVGAHAGFSTGQDGPTQHALEDISLTRTLPNMTVIVPADHIEARKATIAAGIRNGPVYIRLSREIHPAVTTESSSFTIGRVEILRAGKDCTIVACGAMVHEALTAAQQLAKQDIECTVLNCHTIKPLDKHAIITSARLTGCMVTVEEHQTTGGLGSAVAEVLSQHSQIPLKIMGVQDKFGTSGTVQELFNLYGLTPTHITKAVKEVVLRRCENVCTEIPEAHGTKLYTELQPELHFKLRGGGVVKTISGLQKALLSMTDETFSYHCNTHKNDFSTWIKEAMHEPALAKQLDTARTRTSMTLALARWIK